MYGSYVLNDDVGTEVGPELRIGCPSTLKVDSSLLQHKHHCFIMRTEYLTGVLAFSSSLKHWGPDNV